MENKKPKSEINLRKLMQKMGLGTDAFAEACGVSTQSMSQFLRPGKSLTTSTIYNLACALDIDPREMFFPTDSNESEQELANKQEDTDTINEKQNTEEQNIQTTAFCPHCGGKVKVGVVLIPE